MPESDVRNFQRLYDRWCGDRLVGLQGVKPFEFFSADQFLKERSLSDREILIGQVDASEDGGVDSFYAFVNGTFLEDTTPIDSRAGGVVELKIIQSKEHAGFSPTAIGKFGVFVDDLFTFSRGEDQYRCKYHDKLIRLMRIFRNKLLELRERSVPKVEVEYFFITKLDVEPRQNDRIAADKLLVDTSQIYSPIEVKPFRFINVADLWDQFKVPRPRSKPIRLIESFDTKDGCWVGLVNLRNFYEFLKHPALAEDGNPKIDSDIFDSNVRGYQQNTRVNTRITKTLKAADQARANREVPKPIEFWQLNNGITILSANPTYADQVLTIENPQIVNGLQTSRQVFEYYKSKSPLPDPEDDRRILIRVIKTKDEAKQIEIIRATNDQNPMPGEAFLATMRVQRHIEEHFEAVGLFYDRRKGEHKADFKPASQIVGIIELMQAVLAIMLRKPNEARGRPRDYLKDKKRQQLFGADDTDEVDISEPYSLDVYLRCVQINRRVESYLAIRGIDDALALDLRYHMCLDLAARIVRSAHCPPNLIAKINIDRLTDSLLEQSYKRIRALYKRHGASDDAAKGRQMAAGLNKGLKALLSPSNRSKRKRKAVK